MNLDGSLYIVYQIDRYKSKTKNVSFKEMKSLMEIDKMKRETVLRLRKVKKDHDLTISKIMNMIEKEGCFISEATVKRLFSDSSDPLSFKYRDTISPLADVLLEIYDDKSGLEDAAALKSLIHEKNKMIDILVYKNEEQKANYEKQIAHLKKQVDRLERNLDFRERMIDNTDKTIYKLFDSINHKDEIIEKLLKDKMKE